jgi:hypothetical protein
LLAGEDKDDETRSAESACFQDDPLDSVITACMIVRDMRQVLRLVKAAWGLIAKKGYPVILAAF